MIYPRLSTGFDMLVIFTNISLMEFLDQIFGLILSFFRNRRLQVVQDGKS